MNSTLKFIEEDAFMEIVNIGLSKAADSISVILGEKIFSKCVKRVVPEGVFNRTNGDYTSVVTNISGDVQGVCYFLFIENDALYFTLNGLKNSQSEDDFVFSKKNKEFLLELDNIIVSSVVTQLATLLHINMYVDEPKLEQWNAYKNVDPLLDKYYPFFFKTEFCTSDATIALEFYWCLAPSIIANIKKLVGKK